MPEKNRDRRPEAGFALIVAILSLMLLTFLGLSLAATTSTEVQVATNYRWSVQALYNAEAGIEVGKRVLQGLVWSAILPAPRTGPWSPGAASLPANPTVFSTTATRHWELGGCDTLGQGVGYGVVLFDQANTFQDVTVVPTFTTPPALNGAFTLWIRRAVVPVGAGTYKDSTADDAMVLTAEGVAPVSGTTAFTRANVARRLIEATITRQEQPTPCDTRGGQIGGGPEGNNVFGGPCSGLDINNALGNVTFAPGAKTRLP